MDGATQDEIDTIMAVIRAEHVAFWMKDGDAYANCHLHAPYTWWWSYWRHGGISIRHGWDEIGARSGKAMGAFLGPSPSYAYETTWDSITVRVSGDLAWVTFQLHYPSSDGPISDLRGTTSVAYELRLLERHDGEWKIALVSVMVPGLDQLGGPVLRLDIEGRVLWKSSEAAQALEADEDLVVRNGRLRVRNAAADFRLKSAIQWAAQVDRFLMARKGAMPVLMEAGEGLPTKICLHPHWFHLSAIDMGTPCTSAGFCQACNTRQRSKPHAPRTGSGRCPIGEDGLRRTSGAARRQAPALSCHCRGARSGNARACGG